MNNEICKNCKYIRRLKHNFRRKDGFEKSHACIVWEYCDDSDDSVGWIQEVASNDMCEMFTAKETNSNDDTM